MKLRLDLLEFLTAEDIMEEALASVHRYDPEPNFSKTGVGMLRPATLDERAQEIARTTALIERLERRQREAKNTDQPFTSPQGEQSRQ